MTLKANVGNISYANHDKMVIIIAHLKLFYIIVEIETVWLRIYSKAKGCKTSLVIQDRHKYKHKHKFEGKSERQTLNTCC